MYCPGHDSHHGSTWYKISTWATTMVSTVLSSPRQGLLQGLYLYLKDYSIAQSFWNNLFFCWQPAMPGALTTGKSIAECIGPILFGFLFEARDAPKVCQRWPAETPPAPFQRGLITRPSADILMATLSLQIISLLQGRFQDAMGIFHGAVVFQQNFNMFWLFRSCKFCIFFT